MNTYLSNYEMNLVKDPEVLLAKNRIIQKVYELFGRLYEDYKNILQTERLSVTNEIAGKISRGENYKGLPYVILDYPRQFGKTDVFAVRTFFWWGNFFSITLHLSGDYQHRYSAAIENAINKNVLDEWWIGCSDEPWEHHFEKDNYRLIHPPRNYDISNLSHIKIAKKIPLDKWDEAEIFFKENFTFLIKVLGLSTYSVK